MLFLSQPKNETYKTMSRLSNLKFLILFVFILHYKDFASQDMKLLKYSYTLNCFKSDNEFFYGVFYFHFLFSPLNVQ